MRTYEGHQGGEPPATAVTAEECLVVFDGFLNDTLRAMRENEYWLALSASLIGDDAAEEQTRINNEQAYDNVTAAARFLQWLGQNGLYLTIRGPELPPMLLQGLKYEPGYPCYVADLCIPQDPVNSVDLPLDGTHQISIIPGPVTNPQVHVAL